MGGEYITKLKGICGGERVVKEINAKALEGAQKKGEWIEAEKGPL